MKYPIFLLTILCLLSACSNDFDVNADWKEQGVVYGILDLSSDMQYIRVSKAFLDTEEPILSAEEIAAASIDSLYFSDQIVVRLDEYSGSPANFVKSIDLERVSASEAGLPQKEEGFFNNSDYFVYRTSEALKENSNYRLYVLTDGGNEITSQTDLAKNFDVAIPVVSFENDALSNTYEMALFQTLPVSWQRSRNAAFYDLVMKINIEEYGQSSLELEGTENLFFNVATNQVDTKPDAFNTFNIEYPYENFLFFLRDNLDPDPDVIRKIGYIEYIVSAGTEELKQYRDLAINSSAFLNAGQARPQVDNIEGGIGLFAAINQTTRKVPGDRLSNATIEDIACNPITNNLGFTPSPTNLSEVCN